MRERLSPRVSIDTFIKLYNEGKLERALSLGSEIQKAKPEFKSDLAFVITFAKVLIEAEGPSSQIKSLLAEAHLATPDNSDLVDYLEVAEARTCLKQGANKTGETMLKNIIRRSPKNCHAHFILGTHLFWAHGESTAAIPHLETCVRLNPNFLRAWGCLGAIYKKMGNQQLSHMAFQKCAALETNPSMKEFFLAQAA